MNVDDMTDEEFIDYCRNGGELSGLITERHPKCDWCGCTYRVGKVKAKWERDGVQGLPEYTFFIVMFRCTACGLSFEGGCSRKPAPYELQYNIAAWNRICNGDKCFALTYKSLGGRR